MAYKKGDKLIYYKKGECHVGLMDKFIGKVVTVSGTYHNDYKGRPFVLIKEIEAELYFDTYAMKPAISMIR